jgi:hypothetical protein
MLSFLQNVPHQQYVLSQLAYLPIACTENDRPRSKIPLHPPQITEPQPEPFAPAVASSKIQGIQCLRTAVRREPVRLL